MTDEVIDTVLKSCSEAGLDGACFVGIDSVPPVETIVSKAPQGLAVFFGVEFLLPRGRLVWIPEDPADLAKYLPFGRSLEEIVSFYKENGGVMFASHPYDRSDGPSFSDGCYELDDIIGLQVVNCVRDPWRNNMAQEAVTQLKLKGFGGTGRHEAGPGEIGSAATLILEDVTKQSDLAAQLKKDDVWALEFLSNVSQFGEDPADDGRKFNDSGSRGGGRGRGDSQSSGQGQGRGRRDSGRHPGGSRRPQSGRDGQRQGSRNGSRGSSRNGSRNDTGNVPGGRR